MAYLTAEIGLRTDLPTYSGGLGTEARMNVPSTVGPHNWSWRAAQDQMQRSAIGWFGESALAHGRR